MICSIDNCKNKSIARTFCSKHYKRWWSHGDPLFTKKDYRFDPNTKARICSKCKIKKPINEFSIRGGNRGKTPRPYCKACGLLAHRKYANENPLMKRAQSLRASGAQTTAEELDKMLQRANGNCESCDIELDSISNKKKSHASLEFDHCHATGKMRSVLCRGCNLALGIMKENPERIMKLSKYAKLCMKIKKVEL